MTVATKSKLTAVEIYLNKRNKIVLMPSSYEDNNEALVLTLNKNLQNLGFCLSKGVFEVLKTYTPDQLDGFYKQITPILKRMVGANRKFKPMYPNFPTQVMEMSELGLYFNALVHYWSSALNDVAGIPTVLPKYKKEKREPLDEFVNLKLIKLGSEEDFNSIFTQLVGSNSSISQFDKEIVEWFVNTQTENVRQLLPDSIPQKENLCFLIGSLLKHNEAEYMLPYIKTATDVLRIAVVMSEGDVSLATNTRFRNFRRKERRFLLSALENCGNIIEDMIPKKEVWKRLGEKLHPGEYNFSKVTQAFDIIRNNKPYQTYSGKVERFIKNKEIQEAISLLKEKPGIFARRLDHLMRLSDNPSNVIAQFSEISDKVSTPVLLQAFNHFKNREKNSLRTYFPKGNAAKLFVDSKKLPKLSSSVDDLTNQIQNTLVERFKKLPSLGNVYLDPILKDQIVPFSQRSASKTLKTISRGSKIPLPDGNTIRFFLWWKNGTGRTDIDLSASCFNKDWTKGMNLSYWYLRSDFGCHSGDIVDAPKGACEFIDINIDKFLKDGWRYVVMGLYSFTQQPYCDLPECFAGWMARQSAGSGEIFEPKTVQDKIDLAANNQSAIPVILDLVDRQAIWCDLGMTNIPTINNALSHRRTLNALGRAMVDLSKPNLYDLFEMHIKARGKIVNEPSKADICFSLYEFEDKTTITPYNIDTILSEYLL